jgi:glucose/arabinose dehydrogenase
LIGKANGSNQNAVGLSVGSDVEIVTAYVDEAHLSIEGNGSEVALPHAQPEMLTTQPAGRGVHPGHEDAGDAAAVRRSIDIEAVNLDGVILEDTSRRTSAANLGVGDQVTGGERDERGNVRIEQLRRLLRHPERRRDVGAQVFRPIVRRVCIDECACGERRETRRVGDDATPYAGDGFAHPTTNLVLVSRQTPITRHPDMIHSPHSVWTAAALMLAACGGGTSDPGTTVPTDTSQPVTDTPVLTRTVVLQGLSGPWDLAFAADGSMFFTERCRGLSVRRADGTVTRLFGTSGSALVAPDLLCIGQSGVHGVALDPAFATNRTLYVYMLSSLSTSPRTNRVVRLVVNTGYTSVSNRVDIISDIAFKDADNGVGGAGAHSGGRIRFGPDGFLYVTTGDNHNPTLPQSPTMLGGKVLRVTGAGIAAPGNAPPAGFDTRIFTYGHRNVQGITFRPVSGQPFISEHGPNHSDEVTPLVNGRNGGWDPKDRPALGCPSNYCGYAGNASTMPMTDVARFPTALPPSWSNNGASQGMGPAEFLVGSQWRGWNGRLAVGFMNGARLAILALDAAGTTTSAINASLPAAAFRALTLGPDGNLYVATNAGEIWRVTPSTASQ